MTASQAGSAPPLMWHFYQLQRDGHWFEPVVGACTDEEVAADLLYRAALGYEIKVHSPTFIELTTTHWTFKWIKERR